MPLGPSSIYSSPFQSLPFASRRSTVHSTQGIVACTQPLAAHAGQRILGQGGNAADAAVAVAAALNMTEPTSTGIGGDMFCLFYDAKTKQVKSLNGSGRSAAELGLDEMRKQSGVKHGESGEIPLRSILSVTVPGSAAGWVDTVEKFGSGNVGLEDVLKPAIELGEEGFPVSSLAAYYWDKSAGLLKSASPNAGEMLKDGKRAPRAGELFRNPNLANTFRILAAEGKKGFYEGKIAEAIVQISKDLGGSLSLDDLREHGELGTQDTEVLSLRFQGQNATNHGDSQGIDIWEHPPNGQGLVALMALGILEELEQTNKIPTFKPNQHNTPEYLHAVIEALRISFADGNWWIADPDVAKVPAEELISRPYLAERAALFSRTEASKDLHHGSPAYSHNDTVYLAVTDAAGNGCSFINSNYAGFGTGIIPKGCGFTLQNRGANFTLQPPGHPNIYAPRKRPYHTIIPAMLTNPSDSSLHSVYGVMGGFMQPQGHVQVLLNMLAFDMSPQDALDAPRVCLGAGQPDIGAVHDSTVYLEEGIGEEVAEGLRELGHNVQTIRGFDRGMFGRGQLIRLHVEDGQTVHSAGSDPRGDGAAYPVFGVGGRSKEEREAKRTRL